MMIYTRVFPIYVNISTNHVHNINHVQDNNSCPYP